MLPLRSHGFRRIPAPIIQLARIAEPACRPLPGPSLILFSRHYAHPAPHLNRTPRNFEELKRAIGADDPSIKKQKSFRGWAVAWTVLFGLTTTQAYVLLRRKWRHDKLNRSRPPLQWDEFAAAYLGSGRVGPGHRRFETLI